jgi:hypothetical protein
VAASHGFRRASDFALRLDLWCAVDFHADRKGAFSVRCCFFLNGGFSGRDSAQHCEIAGIRVVRSAVFPVWLGFDG